MRTTIAIILLFAFAACSTKIYMPTDANVNKRQTATLADLQQGHDIFKEKCGKCHGYKNPAKYSADQWTKILQKMGPKAKLNQEQISLVYKYVVNF